ncbi:PIF1-like helicase domain-containing protein [Ditylenchus destructor]|uniref:ATP-dependent DNA helicase n=1 Tax=Ditylenchus destructor TaxID=166010 RepID=A0AAD4MFY9_9BILA|nr:PIF1-like helicase domain-containing protein [Ditylenchus destructor]
MYFQEKGQEIMVLLNMPEPNMELNDLLLNLDAVSHAQIAEAMFESMQNNEEQKKFFLMIRAEAASSNPRQTCFYLEGQAGTGKTFTYIAIFHDLMSKGKLVKTMASTGIASTLLPLGRTVHYTAGELQNGDEGYFDFPKACLSDDVITEVFGDCLHNKNYEAMHDRVVLTPYNREADQINGTILDLLEGEEKIYTSVDTLSRDNNLQRQECRLQGTAAQLNYGCAALPTASIPTSMLLDIPSISVAACDVSSLYTSLQNTIFRLLSKPSAFPLPFHARHLCFVSTIVLFFPISRPVKSFRRRSEQSGAESVRSIEVPAPSR